MVLTDKNKNRLRMLLIGPAGQPVWVIKQFFASLPEDCVMVGMSQDFQSQRWGWVFASESYSEVEPGQKIPEMVFKVDGVKKKVEIVREVTAANFMSGLKDL